MCCSFALSAEDKESKKALLLLLVVLQSLVVVLQEQGERVVIVGGGERERGGRVVWENVNDLQPRCSSQKVNHGNAMIALAVQYQIGLYLRFEKKVEKKKRNNNSAQSHVMRNPIHHYEREALTVHRPNHTFTFHRSKRYTFHPYKL
ncbi:hypothetical protein D0Y65_038073 [Glycine soja]|uniref:Secreted protein n=1 Tax=Glycine soja TaxID=3848 RepID=A0A445H3H4_GLYSO|nr:hypothetical protein D0Y65_038073 [Glycine soja]